MKRAIGLACLLLPVLGPAIAQTRSYEYDVRPGQELEIDLHSGGSIEILGWDRDLFVLEARMRGEDILLDVEQVPAGVRVASRFSEHGRSGGVHVKVRVPRRFDLEIRTTGGAIRIDGVEGRISGETQGGELKLNDLQGTVDLTTMGGGIQLNDSRVGGKLKTYGGNVQLKNVEGAVEAHTMGGNVIYDNVRPSRSSDEQEVRVSTMGGNVTVPEAPSGADVETMGGNIRIDSAGEYVKAKTMGGNIFIGSVDGWVKASTMSGDVTVTMVGDAARGRRDVRLSSQGGDISLTLPDGLSMELDLTLAYTKKSRMDFSIDSDFPLETRKSDYWDYGSGSGRKYIYGTATLDGGRNKVKIETVNGDIRLIRGR